jgi:hypothetical protein
MITRSQVLLSSSSCAPTVRHVKRCWLKNLYKKMGGGPNAGHRNELWRHLSRLVAFHPGNVDDEQAERMAARELDQFLERWDKVPAAAEFIKYFRKEWSAKTKMWMKALRWGAYDQC